MSAGFTQAPPPPPEGSELRTGNTLAAQLRDGTVYEKQTRYVGMRPDLDEIATDALMAKAADRIEELEAALGALLLNTVPHATDAFIDAYGDEVEQALDQIVAEARAALAMIDTPAA